MPVHLTTRDVRIILMMLSAALRSPVTAGDQRRAIEFAQAMLFTT